MRRTSINSLPAPTDFMNKQPSLLKHGDKLV